MEYHYQSDHRRSYRYRGSTWHPILYSLIFNFNHQSSIIMGKAYCFYQNYREVSLPNNGWALSLVIVSTKITGRSASL